MFPVLLSFGPFRITSYATLFVLGVFVSMFLWWRVGRSEHFDEKDLFDTGFVTLLSYFVFGRLGHVFYNFDMSFGFVSLIRMVFQPGFLYGVGVFGAVLALVFKARQNEWNVWRALDSYTSPLTVAIVFSSLGLFLHSPNLGKDFSILSVSLGERVGIPIDLVASAWFLLASFIVSKVRRNFRFYSWYKGDRGSVHEGLAFLVLCILVGMYYLLRGMLDDGLSMFGPVSRMSVFGVSLVVVSSTLVYLFSGREITQDLPFMRRFKKDKVSKERGKYDFVSKKTS